MLTILLIKVAVVLCPEEKETDRLIYVEMKWRFSFRIVNAKTLYVLGNGIIKNSFTSYRSAVDIFLKMWFSSGLVGVYLLGDLGE